MHEHSSKSWTSTSSARFTYHSSSRPEKHENKPQKPPASENIFDAQEPYVLATWFYKFYNTRSNFSYMPISEVCEASRAKHRRKSMWTSSQLADNKSIARRWRRRCIPKRELFSSLGVNAVNLVKIEASLLTFPSTTGTSKDNCFNAEKAFHSLYPF